MAWIEALQRHEALWTECKEYFVERKREQLEKLLSVTPDKMAEQVGIVKGIQFILDDITAKERESYARLARSKR
jgi:hypothetical protein